jgi:hypothetical protein
LAERTKSSKIAVGAMSNTAKLLAQKEQLLED